MTALSHAQWRELGRAARQHVPRSAMGAWDPPADRRDPLDILQEQNASRVPELIALRHRRMLESPFTFYRGTAAIMAADLASTPHTGIVAQLVGDAHLANFGGFASPERDFVFDLNDFDETLPGPFEWDLKRLVASFVVAGRYRGFEAAHRDRMVRTVVRTYRESMASFARQSRLSIWYARLDVDAIIERWAPEAGRAAVGALQQQVAKAKLKTSQAAMDKHVLPGPDRPRFRSSPPELVPVEEMLNPDQSAGLERAVTTMFAEYLASLPQDRRALLSGYRLRALAHKVVGVGSVGTRCWLALFTVADDDHDPLMLQIKEANRSVLEPYLNPSEYTHQGRRVVEGQHLIQAVSDILLGWTTGTGLSGRPHDYYVRQLWDWKYSADLETMTADTFLIYAEICGWTLARAHARSGHPTAITSFLGTGDNVDRALVRFAEAYADQNEADYQWVAQAAHDGRIPFQA